MHPGVKIKLLNLKNIRQKKTVLGIKDLKKLLLKKEKM